MHEPTIEIKIKKLLHKLSNSNNSKKYADISVIIPCYQAEKTLVRAVSSIINQTLLPKEIILINDASTDNTLSLLKLFEKSNPTLIKTLSLDSNQGVSHARNCGWKIASQPYICFLDADDAWHPMKIQVQYEYMTKNKTVFMSGLKSSRLSPTNFDSQIDKSYSHSHVNIQTKEIKKNSLIFKNPFTTSTVMLLNTSEFRFTENKRYAEDILLWQQIIFSGKKAMLLNEYLAYSFKHAYRDPGLSSNLYSMEKEELKNFIFLYKKNLISPTQLFYSYAFSLIKLIKRILF